MEQFTKFRSIMLETLQLLDSIIAIENKKLDAIAIKDATKLETLMNEEQAFLLQFRGFDKKREEWQKEQGWESLTFREIILRLSPEQQADIQPVYQQMSEKVKEVKEVTACVKKYLEINLHSLNSLISSMQKGSAGTPYNNAGKTQMPAGSRKRKLPQTRV